MWCEGNPCKRCGAPTRDGYRRVCGQSPSQPGLGDYTEAMLQSIGVTKERYQAAKQLFGLSPTCDCDQRKEWLNRVSDWWRSFKR